MSNNDRQPRMEFEDGAIAFYFPPGHPATIVVARLIIVCPHHTDEVITECHLHADGQSAWLNMPGFSSEHVNDTHLDIPPGRLPSFMKMPDAVVTDGSDVAHVRFHFRCLLPSCNVDMQRRTDGASGMLAVTDAILTRMTSDGIEALTVTNIDAESWRVVVRK